MSFIVYKRFIKSSRFSVGAHRSGAGGGESAFLPELNITRTASCSALTDESDSFPVNVKLEGVKAGDEKPAVALYLFGTNGRLEKVATAKDGRLSIPRKIAKKSNATVALGPDVDGPQGISMGALLQFRSEDLQKWEKSGTVYIPKSVWPGWLQFLVCLSGKVERCLPILWDPLQVMKGLRLNPPIPHPRCAPVCAGIVEIYEKECCCDVRYIPIDISDIIKRLEEILATYPPIPIPDPGPVSNVDRNLLYKIQLARSTSSPMFAGEPQLDLVAEVSKISAMPTGQAEEYIRSTDFYRPFICSCTSRKLGEAVLGPDGSFSYCYLRFPVRNPSWKTCSFYYCYKVKQWNGSSWAYIYNGQALNQDFSSDQLADLTTFWGTACDPGPVVDGDTPYVMLENIGGTESWNLVSPGQTGELSLSAPPDNGGLVFPPSGGGSDIGAFLNCPWGQALSFRLRFDPRMQALGATYYRISIVPTSNGSSASGPAQPLSNGVTWGKLVYQGGQWIVQYESLGPNIVGAQSNLYKIPYGTDWLWYQYHNSWDTTTLPNGRYFVSIEVFDAAGNRLKPTTAPGAGTPTNFIFLKMLDSVNTADVLYPTLLHLFWTDNSPCVGHIEDLRMDGLPNSDECQYMMGDCCSTFSAGFRAFHATRNSPTAPETFMYYYQIWYHRGLGGSNVTTDTGGTNQPGTLGAGNPAESTPQSFCDMLGLSRNPGNRCEPSTHGKCSFALNLYAWAKHWNGSGRLSQYDASDQAAFSLEV